MRLTRYTDYAIRTLAYLAARPERLSSIAEVAAAYGVSQNHLMKVVHELAKAGYVETVRGRSGGMRLAKPAGAITVGEIVRLTEDGFDLVDCGSCAINGVCGVKGALAEATRAFLGVLDRHSFETPGGGAALRMALDQTPRLSADCAAQDA
ncbi:Rrf2 family transcriptional regulator [Methylopila henanensis]|uniref:Rrf2 family transcriptional regulator n=1 Tax=Methylopila henanensis TaxID=873516 RepID=A0ABW4K5U0_9HYPH